MKKNAINCYCKIICAAITALILIQCKSQESHLMISDGNNMSVTPTLILKKELVEHQYEGGKDSGVLVKVEIAGEVTKVPQWAFAIVPTLEEVKLAPGVKTLEDNAFFSCKNLSKINLNHVESVGENCFKFTALKRVELRKTRRIKEFAFSCCGSLKDVVFSGCLESIGEFAFSGDTAIVSCDIPAGKIEACAFMGCSKLQKISFGKVVSIGNAAFMDCTSITSMVIPSSVTYIGSEAFSGCVNLKKVIVNSRNTMIEEDAFSKDVIITYKK